MMLEIYNQPLSSQYVKAIITPSNKSPKIISNDKSYHTNNFVFGMKYNLAF